MRSGLFGTHGVRTNASKKQIREGDSKLGQGRNLRGERAMEDGRTIVEAHYSGPAYGLRRRAPERKRRGKPGTSRAYNRGAWQNERHDSRLEEYLFVTLKDLLATSIGTGHKGRTTSALLALDAGAGQRRMFSRQPSDERKSDAAPRTIQRAAKKTRAREI